MKLPLKTMAKLPIKHPNQRRLEEYKMFEEIYEI